MFAYIVEEARGETQISKFWSVPLLSGWLGEPYLNICNVILNKLKWLQFKLACHLCLKLFAYLNSVKARQKQENVWKTSLHYFIMHPGNVLFFKKHLILVQFSVTWYKSFFIKYSTNLISIFVSDCIGISYIMPNNNKRLPLIWILITYSREIKIQTPIT